jgi:hypothetical protein
MFRTDLLAIKSTATPKARKLESECHVLMDELGHIQHSASTTEREGTLADEWLT